MIKSVWVRNQNGDRLDLNLRESGEALGIYIFNLEGLGSPEATVNGTGGPGFDGIRVNSVRADSRHMTFSLAMGVQGAREEAAKAMIYKFFPVKQTITLGIVTDMHEVYTEAIVESNPFTQFAKVENATISMLSPMPYFQDVSVREHHASQYSGIPLFEFPFSNESLTEPLLEFGQITESPTIQANYPGSVESGVTIDILLLDDVEDITIANSNGSQVMTLDLSGALGYFGSPSEINDRIFINTRVGQKSAYYVRDGVYYNMLNGIGLNDDWIEVRPGNNLIVLTAASGQEDVEIDILFRPLREGI